MYGGPGWLNELGS